MPQHLPLPRIQPMGVGDDAYRMMVEAVTDYAIFLLDPEGHIQTWNAGAQLIKGYRADEVIGRHFSMFYPRELLDADFPATELRVAQEVGRFENEGFRLRKDGSRFWANVVITALKDDAGRLVGFSKITRDLSGRREHEERLRSSEERFRLLVEAVRDYAIFMLYPDGRIASWNAGAQKTKGYAAEEIIGQHFSVFYPPDVAASGWPARELELALQHGSFEDEGWRVRKDGSRFWASVVITSVHDHAGRHIGFAKVTRDLTEKRRVRTLEDEGRRITTFIAMLGHELRNPLAPIMNAVSVMQLEHLESARLRLCRDIIARQLQQMVRLVDDLLDVGRITSGKISLDLQLVSLAEIVTDAVEMVEPLVEQHGHALSLALPDRDVIVCGDRPRLLQIVSNLLNNAARYTPNGGRIEVALRSGAAGAEISVRDNGRGIPPQQLTDIFNIFVQGDEAGDRGGLGLGLSLVQQLVTLHRGEVSAFSTGEPGKGSEFVVRLPLAATAAGAAPASTH
ncbi:MAG TPA: PAS domain-containing sensor histidine kinase [Luteimonas sp.]